MKLPVSSSSKFDFQQLSEDFKRLSNNDPGTWPFVPKVTVLVGVFVAITALGGYFLWLDQFELLSQAETKEAKLKEEFLEKKRQAVNLDLYRQQLEEIDKSFGALLKQLPNRNEVESLLVEVNQAGLGRGLQFELFKPAAEVVKDFYAELPINVKINGAYHDLGAFAADVAKLPRIVTLNNININMPGGKDGGAQNSGRLVMDMQVKTFRYLDEEEIAKRRQEEKDKAKGGKKK
ncbi:type 4a pilus biogenesis protein PilO [Azovibrio restrictus]|uniref:type 4a pilus biogenesis protein PilO n=1 Tax=Azovibrio restrictus TaxID=146938 RepID=UPI000407E3B6|nr:type 4a pilus biogenesis protein PilO [Azovibrio restrictus]